MVNSDPADLLLTWVSRKQQFHCVKTGTPESFNYDKLASCVYKATSTLPGGLATCICHLLPLQLAGDASSYRIGEIIYYVHSDGSEMTVQ